MNTKAYVILFSLILAACGGGSSDGGVMNNGFLKTRHLLPSTCRNHRP